MFSSDKAHQPWMAAAWYTLLEMLSCFCTPLLSLKRTRRIQVKGFLFLRKTKNPTQFFTKKIKISCRNPVFPGKRSSGAPHSPDHKALVVFLYYKCQINQILPKPDDMLDIILPNLLLPQPIINSCIKHFSQRSYHPLVLEKN